MTQYTKPTVLPAWGESAGGADVLQPTNAEIQAGWPLSNVPPSRKRFNWILKYLAQGVRYMMQMGIPVWDSTEDYPVNARVMGSDGKTYKAILTGINKDPTTQPTYWTRWGFTLAELNAEGTTPPQFDNDTSLATTAFVQRALGNMSGYVTYAAPTLLAAADAGKHVIITLSGAQTCTLPDPATMPPGASFHLEAVGGELTVTCTGATGSSFAGPSVGVPAASFKVLNANSVDVVCIGSSYRVLGGGGKASLNASGYQKLPSGLIIQWGNITNSATPGNATLVTFPIVFPSAIRQLVVSSNVNSTSISAAWYDAQTPSGFNMRSNVATSNASYIAIGD